MANIVRRNEAGVPDLRREIDRLFEDFFAPGGLGSGRLQEFVPRFEVSEIDDGYVLRAELPGLKPEDVELNVDHDVLTVSGEKKREQSRQTRGGYAYTELNYGSFSRSIQLPPGTDASKIKADFNHGMLEVQIPKSEAARPRRIRVDSAPRGAPQVEAGIGEKPRAEAGKSVGATHANAARAQH